MKIFLTMTALLSVLAIGCSPADPGGDAESSAAVAETVSLPEGVILTEKPADAESLFQVKGKAKTGDEVKFSARIGGRKKPFVDGRAVMVVIDPSLQSCADMGHDWCAVPWDYCCETPENLAANTATVQLVDDAGKPLALTLKGKGDLAELDWITVVGKVEEKDEGGLFVVNATGLFLEKKGAMGSQPD